MVEYLSEHKKVLTYKEACNLVENHYDEETQKLFNLKKIKSKLQNPAGDAPKQKKEESKTLKNAQTTEIEHKNQPLSEHERLKRAADLLRFK